MSGSSVGHLLNKDFIFGFFLFQASRTALHKASIGGRWRAVKMLLEHGEDANQGDKVLSSFRV